MEVGGKEGGKKEKTEDRRRREVKFLRISCIQSDVIPWCNLAASENPCATQKRLCEAASQEAGCSETKVLMHLKSSSRSFHTYSVGKAGLNEENRRKWGREYIYLNLSNS